MSIDATGHPDPPAGERTGSYPAHRMPLPQATVVIPCFNHGRFVGDAVASALAQTDAQTQVVVVNDGSTDGTTPHECDALPDRFGRDRVRVLHQPNTGLPGARNAGALGARTEHLVFLDADDWIEPAFVSTLARALEGDARASHAYCQERLVELGQGIWRVPEWDAELLLLTNLHPVTCLLRRDVFERAGGFDASMTGGYEDWELWIRLSTMGFRGVRVPEPLFVWRRHSNATMIFDAVKRHAELYGAIRARHRAHYDAHADALVARANSMLRDFDCNWIDETGVPIPLRHLREQAQSLPRLRAELREAREQTARERDRAAQERREAEERLALLRAGYESMGLVRLHHRVHRLLRAMPRPVGAPLLSLLSMLRRLFIGPGTPRKGP